MAGGTPGGAPSMMGLLRPALPGPGLWLAVALGISEAAMSARVSGCWLAPSGGLTALSHGVKHIHGLNILIAVKAESTQA